jgi:hypothetical protein
MEMSLNSAQAVKSKIWVPKVAKDSEVSVLTDIYNDETNIVVWQREINKVLENYASGWMSDHATHALQSIMTVDNAMNNLSRELPEQEHKIKFREEVFLLIDMFTCLFDTDTVGLRITPLSAAMCPRFHIDKIACRLVVTYGGPGTEWLPESNLDRRSLGIGAKGHADHESGVFREQQCIQKLATQEVALLKGSAWEGNEHYALTHRSPHLDPGQTRLLLTLDIF